MKNKHLLILGIIAVSFAVAISSYGQLPDTLVSHWGINGEPNGYIGKFWGLFLMPIISLVIYALYIVIPKIDPLKENIEKFKKYFDDFFLALMLFFFYVYLLTVLWNFGYRFNMSAVLMPAFAALFYYMGVLLEHAKQNWFVGIRTPWTLSSENVWDKTHEVTSRMFKALAALFLIAIFMPKIGFILVISGAIATAIFSIIYSYVLYAKEKR